MAARRFSGLTFDALRVNKSLVWAWGKNLVHCYHIRNKIAELSSAGVLKMLLGTIFEHKANIDTQMTHNVLMVCFNAVESCWLVLVDDRLLQCNVEKSFLWKKQQKNPHIITSNGLSKWMKNWLEEFEILSSDLCHVILRSQWSSWRWLNSLGAIRVARKEILLIHVSAEVGKRIYWVEVESVNRISILTLNKQRLPSSNVTRINAG